MSRSNTSYWNKLMRVHNGVLENESISSIAARPGASQQVSE